MKKKTNIPYKLYGMQHIAFIMDGNGRWATRRGMPREYGHKAGAKAFRETVKYCRSIGLKYVTVYALSTENLKLRPKSETGAIMRLLSEYISECEREMDKYNVSFRFPGDTSVFDDDLRERLRLLTERTADRELVLNVALNYGSRAELARAFSILAAAGKKKITEEDVDAALYTAGCPDPDLIIRSANEHRLSNFLLWQASYSELYFTDVLWPDFGSAEIDAAIKEYGRRRRRYGGVL